MHIPTWVWMIGARAMIALVAASTCARLLSRSLRMQRRPTRSSIFNASSAPAWQGKSLGPAGSQLTIMLMMKRDGSIFGKPRITFSHLEGDRRRDKRFVDDAERAVEACLPFRITPSLGGAIAGRPFVITLGRPKPEQKI